MNLELGLECELKRLAKERELDPNVNDPELHDLRKKMCNSNGSELCVRGRPD